MAFCDFLHFDKHLSSDCDLSKVDWLKSTYYDRDGCNDNAVK